MNPMVIADKSHPPKQDQLYTTPKRANKAAPSRRTCTVRFQTKYASFRPTQHQKREGKQPHREKHLLLRFQTKYACFWPSRRVRHFYHTHSYEPSTNTTFTVCTMAQQRICAPTRTRGAFRSHPILHEKLTPQMTHILRRGPLNRIPSMVVAGRITSHKSGQEKQKSLVNPLAMRTTTYSPLRTTKDEHGERLTR